MDSIFYYLMVYVLVSAVGMYAANKKVSPQIRSQRWLKFFTYMLITLVVLAAIFSGKLSWLTVIIIVAATFELFHATFRLAAVKYNHFHYVLLIFAFSAFGFFSFARIFIPTFQLFIFFQVFTFDAMCQITGQLFGRHSLSVSISPSKTVEGFIGGSIFCLISAILGASWIGVSWSTALIMGSVTAVTAFCGDMMASYYKRLLKIKDYSNLLPGQGGFLDRFDSLIFTGAVYYVLLEYLISYPSLKANL